MTRAVVSYPQVITALIPRLGKIIPRCSYSPDIRTIMFRHGDLGVFIEPERIIVYNVREESVVKELLEWLKRLLLESGKEDAGKG